MMAKEDEFPFGIAFFLGANCQLGRFKTLEELVSSLKAVRQGWKRHVRVRFHVSFVSSIFDVSVLFVVGG